MEVVKGRLLKKLKSIKPPPIAIGYLKQPHQQLDHFIAVATADDGYVHNLVKNTIFKSRQQPHNHNAPHHDFSADKENARPKQMPEILPTKADTETSSSPNRRRPSEYHSHNNNNNTPLSEIDISGFRRPDLNSSSLFDPNLLAAFEQAVKDYFRISEQARRRIEEAEDLEFKENEEPPAKVRKVEEEEDGSSLGLEGNNKCPPGGRGSVVFYTTSLRGIRKTFEDCSQVRFLLESFRIVYYERDVSMHSEYKEELREIMGKKGTIPPRVFVKGRYIGGAEEVVRLHEQGRLKPLLEGVELKQKQGVCKGCAGIRFVICPECNGSHKIIVDKGSESVASCCSECNENGLMVCPMCSKR